MLLKLCYYNNPILRKKCKPVKEITDEIKRLAQDMIETMDAGNGVGLAAPQVGKDLAIFVMREDKYTEEGELVLGDAKVFINPKLSNPSKETNVHLEGCLSLPGLHLDIERPNVIYVEAMDLEGNITSQEFTDFTARIIMHENDHLNGVLFIDRIPKKTKKKIEPSLRKIKEKYEALR
ncbi:MAG: peptide deformylase [Chlamydiota bacterium]|jgi:peptide deformylase